MTLILSRIRLTIVAVTGLLLASAVPAQQAASPYLSQVTRGEGGSHILGNPAAPVRLTEYVSYTCSHCRDFVEEAGPSLQRYIGSGQVSLEVRHLVLSAPDIGMTVAAQCGSAGRFFSRHDSLFALQPSVLQRTAALSEARVAAIVALLVETTDAKRHETARER